MSTRVAVASADFIRNIGHWQSEALKHPVSITYHGRERLVLAAADEFTPANRADADTTLQSDYTSLRAMYASLVDQIDEAYLTFDESFNLRYANPTAEAFAGFALIEMQEKGILGCLPHPFASMLLDRLRRVARTRKVEFFEAGPVQGKYVGVRVFPASTGVSVTFQNTTEQHRLKAEREESEAVSAALAQHACSTTLRLDTRGRLEQVGERFCERTGFVSTEIVGHRLVEIVPPALRTAVMEAVEAVLRNGERAMVDLTIVGKRGQEIAGELALAPILSDFAPRGVMGVFMMRAQSSAHPESFGDRRFAS